MTIRLHVDAALEEGAEFELPEGAARHAQVRRVQPGDALRIFDGRGAERAAQVLEVGRRAVRVRLGAPQPTLPEPAWHVTLALGMPANERMDFLVEKATELGVSAIQPLHCARSVLRLEGERAARRRAHWQSVAVAAAEQCGRAVVPEVAPVQDFAPWCAALPEAGLRVVLSLAPGAEVLASLPAFGARATGNVPKTQPPRPHCAGRVLVLSGPEGGLAPQEEAQAVAAGFEPLSLGPRVLRADTAPLAMLAWLVLGQAQGGRG